MASEKLRDISGYLDREAPSSYGKFELPEDNPVAAIVDGETVTIPAGFKALLVQPRHCGDYYAELSGIGAKAATGETRVEAVKGVIALAGASV